MYYLTPKKYLQSLLLNLPVPRKESCVQRLSLMRLLIIDISSLREQIPTIRLTSPVFHIFANITGVFFLHNLKLEVCILNACLYRTAKAIWIFHSALISARFSQSSGSILLFTRMALQQSSYLFKDLYSGCLSSCG